MKDKINPEDVVRGLETTLEELEPVLKDQIDGMSTKQLRRALDAAITFIAKAKDERDMGALGHQEQRFIGGLITLIESSRQYYLHIIGQIQKEQMEAEMKESGDV